MGNAQQALKDYTLKFVTVAQDSFMTEINLSAPLTGYFDAGEDVLSVILISVFYLVEVGL